MSDIRHESTTVWHRGKSRTFKDEGKAKEWLKEIKMANQEKGPVKGPYDERPVTEKVAVKGPYDEYPAPKDGKPVAGKGPVESPPGKESQAGAPHTLNITVPESCADCGVTFGASNVGGVLVTHPTKLGETTGVALNQAEADTWCATIHAQENA